MLTDKDIRDIQGYLKGLLPPHREERFRERLNNEPDLKAKFDELSPMLNALEEIKFENKIRDIITQKDVEPVEIEEEIIVQKAIPLYKRMWVYAAAACVLVFAVVGIDYRKNQKMRDELLVIERNDKARQDSLKAVYAKQRKLMRKIDSTIFDRPENNIIVKKKDSVNKFKTHDNQKNVPKNEKIIVKKSYPENKKEERNDLEEEENENPEISSLNGQNQFTKKIDILYKKQPSKIMKTNEVVEGKVNIRLSKNTFGTSNQIGSVIFMEQTNTFSLSIFDKEIFNLLRKNDITIKQQPDESFLLDLGNRQLQLNTKTRVIK